MNLPKYISAQKVLTFYIDKLENDDSEEAKWCLQWINLQMLRFQCDNHLSMLMSYPLEIGE